MAPTHLPLQVLDFDLEVVDHRLPLAGRLISADVLHACKQKRIMPQAFRGDGIGRFLFGEQRDVYVRDEVTAASAEAALPTSVCASRITHSTKASSACTCSTNLRHR